MKKMTAFCLGLLLLQGCAGVRGFTTGALSGTGVVDEVVNGTINESYVNTNSVEFNTKMWTHRAILISTSLVLWPFAAAYGGASGLYGAYKFHKYYNETNEWQVLYR